MCARYVLMPSGETVLVPSEKLLYLPNGALILDKKHKEAIKSSLSDRFAIAEWISDPLLSYHVCPTNSGIIIIEKNGKRIALNSQFAFQRRWKAKTGKIRSYVGNNFRFDNLLPKDYENQGFHTNESPRGNWVYYPAFKRKQTCLVVLWGFVEFVKEEGKSVGYYTEMKSGEPIVAAGLFEEINGTFFHTMGTVDPNEQMERIKHDRLLSVLIHAENQNIWLTPKASTPEKMKNIEAIPANILHSWRLGPKINNPKNKGADVLERIGGIISVAA